MSAALHVDTRIRTVQKRAFGAGAINAFHVYGTGALPKGSSSPCRHVGANEDTQTDVSSTLRTVIWVKCSTSGHFNSMVDTHWCNASQILFHFTFYAILRRNISCDFRTTCHFQNYMRPSKAKRWSFKHFMSSPHPLPQSVRCSADQCLKAKNTQTVLQNACFNGAVQNYNG